MKHLHTICAIILLMASLTLLAACGQSAQQPSVEQGQTAVNDSTQVATPVEAATSSTVSAANPMPTAKQAKPADAAIAPYELPLTASLPRGVTYAGLEWTVKSALIDNRRISLFGTTEERTDDYRVVRIDLQVKNPLSGYTKLDSDVVKLQLAEGTRYEADETGRVDLPGGDAETTSKLIFRVPADATWKDAKLVISESERVPAEIALDGPMSSSSFPQKLAAAGSVTIEEVTYTVLESSFDLDLHAVRSKEHERFLYLKVRVENNSAGGGGLALTDDAFRLQVTGAAQAPADDFAELVKPNSSYDATVVFAVPEDLSETELMVGEGKTAAVIKLDLAQK